MQRAELEQEQLWNHIQACKQNETPNSNGHRNGGSNGAAGYADALLVSALSAALDEDRISAAVGATAPRALLRAAIHADTTSRIVRRPPARKFWNVAGRRQLLLAVALCLVTVSALGYLTWYFHPFDPACNSGPPVISSPPARGVSPQAPAGSDKSTRKSSAASSAQTVGAKAEAPTPQLCR
jgi:hypothetical protein